MRSPKELTREQILQAASGFRSLRKMPKWTVIVEKRELPARPLVLEAAGVPPNDPTNSHQAVAILEKLGFETRYAGANGERAAGAGAIQSSDAATDMEGLLETVRRITSKIPEEAWKDIPADLSINVDHYLYGHPKKEE